MYKHFLEVLDFWKVKVLAGLLSMVFNENFYMLLVIFFLLTLLDTYTRWLANSASLWKHMYPNTPGSLWIYTKRIYNTWTWRWISSSGLRAGFADKYMVYMLLILVSSLADAALVISKSPLAIGHIVITALCITETISVCENLSECGVGFVGNIKEKLEKKLGGDK